MKSSRVVFTMIFGVFITHKKYNLIDYTIVFCMVIGLAIFMHADAASSAVFQPLGVVMLVCFEYRDPLVYRLPSMLNIWKESKQHQCYMMTPDVHAFYSFIFVIFPLKIDSIVDV